MTTRSDVLVVGAGLAGMRAALAAAEAGAEVLLADRGPIGMGTNSALANGVFSGPASPADAEQYIRLVIDIGKGINRVASVRRLAQDAPAAVAFLQSLELALATRHRQWMVQPPRPGVIPGIPLVRRVAEQVLRCERIRVARGVLVTAILQAAGRAMGARGLDLHGVERDFHAPAVILACGGAGAIYAKHDNQATILGQGYALAARAGVDLWDMEFVQFYPIVLDEPGMPMMMIYPPYPPEARLIGPAGDDLLGKHNLGDINRAAARQRDTFSALLLEEGKAGPVCMDLRDVPEERWEVHPLSILRRFKTVCQSRPIRVTPAGHFCMGGVRVDDKGQTSLRGMFACGEMVWGLHGANRMGGNALMECLVTGSIAGREAAGFAREGANPLGEGDCGPAALPTAGASKPDFWELRRRLQETAWRCAGVVRSGEAMARGLTDAEAVYAAIGGGRAETPRERILCQDLLSAAFSLRAILTAGLGRLESRGCFIRSDFPEQDDAHWLKNSRLSWDPSANRFSLAYEAAETA